MNNKNKISNSYKDYKYEYTGYKDFIKKHHLDKDEIKKEKDKIVHDHTFKFDFNNPNQHHHDYSFDFNNPNEHHHDYSFDFSQNEQPRSKVTYKDKYGNVYPAKQNVYSQQKTTTQTTTKTKYNGNTRYTATTTYNQNNNKSQKTIKIIMLLLFLLPIILNFIGLFFSLIFNFFDTYEDEENNDYYYEITEKENNNYMEPINYFCDGLEKRSFSIVKPYITYEEIEYDKGINWMYLIYDNYNQITSSTTSCGSKYYTALSENEINSLNTEFNFKYYSNKNITNAYRTTITKLTANGNYNGTYKIIIGKIDNEWYLIKEMGDDSY